MIKGVNVNIDKDVQLDQTLMLNYSTVLVTKWH